MNVTDALTRFAAETAAEAIPSDALRMSQRLVVDTLGVSTAAATLETAQPLLAEVESWGGTPEATVLGTGQRTSAVQAAYANAYLANLLDADETLLNYAHLANAIVPAALAAGERVGTSGRDLLAAVAVGYEVAARIGTAYRIWRLVDGRPEWAPVAGYSWVVFGVAAAVGRIVGLDPRQLASAFGIAGYSTPAPSIGKWVDSTALPHTKYVFLGPLAHAGVAAALLAARGFEGDDDVLEGERGFWRIAGSDACDWEAMTRDLGRCWLLGEVSFKLYPACRFYHGPLDQFADLLERERLEPDRIERVVVRLPPAAQRPYFTNPSPANVVEGSFSVPHAFACLAHRLLPGPAWHTVEALRRPDLARFRARVEVAIEPRAAPLITEQLVDDGVSFYRRCPTSLRVETADRAFEASADYASGDPWTEATRLDDGALERKFVSYTTPVLGSDGAQLALRFLQGLDELADVRSLPLSAPGMATSDFYR